MRREGNEFITRPEVMVYVEDEPVEDVISRLREAAEGLTNPVVTGHGWEDRDRDQTGYEINVTGDRPATPDEIASYRRTEAQRMERDARLTAAQLMAQTRRDQEALARARAVFPEQFKD